MKLRRVLPAILLFVFGIPVCAQVLPPHEVDSLLTAASNALDHWQQLAPQIHCEDAIQSQLREDCKTNVLGMGERVQDAKAQIARYRQQSTPQVVHLFDAYQSFRRVLELAEDMNFTPYFYGERNQQALAETYNNFVKINGWFEGVVRESILDAAKCSDHTRT